MLLLVLLWLLLLERIVDARPLLVLRLRLRLRMRLRQGTVWRWSYGCVVRDLGNAGLGQLWQRRCTVLARTNAEVSTEAPSPPAFGST